MTICAASRSVAANLTLRERRRYSKMARKQGKDAVIRRDKTPAQKKEKPA